MPQAGHLDRRGLSRGRSLGGSLAEVTSEETSGGAADRSASGFAPSPTGYFHVGGARTALYNWCFRSAATAASSSCGSRTPTQSATRRSGSTGSSRPWPGSASTGTKAPSASLSVGTCTRRRSTSSGPDGYLYACDCTREMVLERTKDNPTPGYDGFCRDRGLERRPGRALRFTVPRRRRDGGAGPRSAARSCSQTRRSTTSWSPSRTAIHSSCSPSWSTTGTCASAT